MSRKFDRKKKVIELSARVLEKTMSDPNFIIQNMVNDKPKYLPMIIWKWMVKKVVKFPKM